MNMQNFLKSFSTISILSYLISLLIVVAFCSNPAAQAIIYLSIAFTVYLVNRTSIKRAIIISVVIGLPILIINPIVNGMGETVLLSLGDLPLIGNINITLEAMFFSLSLTLKLMTTVLAFSLFNLLVHPDKLLNLVSFFAPKSALVVGLSTRMIPSLLNQLREIGEIQRTRGVELDSKNLVQKIRSWYPFTKLIMFSSLENSYGIAEAIESKGFGFGKRTIFFNEKIKSRDILLYIDSALMLLVLGAGLFNGLLEYSFFPRLDRLIKSDMQLILILCVIVLVLFPLILAWGCSRWKYLRQRI